MKYILTFERISKYGRQPKQEYVSKEDTDAIESVMRQYIESQNLIKKIEDLEYEDFYAANFNYKQFFKDFITLKNFQRVNVYNAVDKYCKENKLTYSTPTLRDIEHTIINKIYTEYLVKTDWKNRMDMKLVEEIEKDPANYTKILKEFKDKLNPNVKDACDWMLNTIKFNL
jgi:Tol biopolymer transport system component